MNIDRRQLALPALALGLLSVVPAFAGADEDAVAKNVEAFRVAQAAGNAEGLASLCAEEMSYSHSNAKVDTKASFVTAIKHLVKANVLGMIEILKRRHDAIFIQSESSEYYHADSPAAIGRAEVLNQMRFLSLDLNYGRRVDSGMYQFLMDSGMTREEYEWFLDHRLKQHCILGNDYYQLNEHRVFADGHTVAAGETFGYSEITRQYYNRYRVPVMHTETNLWEGPHGDEAVKWLWKEWANVLRLRNVGIPTVGFTWYSLTDQVDWDTALREQNGNVNPLGLFDLDRKIRNVGKAYKQLIADWRNVLPASSVCLVVPIKKVSEHPDDAGDDAAGRRFGGSGTQASEAEKA